VNENHGDLDDSHAEDLSWQGSSGLRNRLKEVEFIRISFTPLSTACIPKKYMTYIACEISKATNV